VRKVVRLLRNRGLRTVDVLVTHWDQDHYRGAIQIAKAFTARRIYYNHDTLIADASTDLSRRAEVLRSLLDDSLQATALDRASEGQTGTVGRVSWKLLAPSHRDLTAAVVTGDRNKASGVVHLMVGAESVVVGGDADGQVWHRLMLAGVLPQGGILRCSHHGGMDTSGSGALSELQLAQQIRPKHLIVSVGSHNGNGHPRPEVVQAALAVGARVMCTQVTAHCHSALSRKRGGTACAGDVVLNLSSGTLLLTPDVVDHAAVIAQWNQPMCLSSRLAGS
jgi:beta-lactamase superfamily II metal-dependent hydrolase